MSDIRISELPLIATPASLLDADVYPLVNNGVTQKIQFDTLYTKISSVILTDVVFNSEFSTLETVVGSNSGNWNSTYSTVGANSASWGATTVNILTALSLFREISSSSSPNTSDWPAQGLSAFSSTATNIDFVLRPKGTGAVLVNIPDGTSAGGSKRGEYAVDLQRIRGDALLIASGDYSVICGGSSNVARGLAATVGGGSGNQSGSSSGNIYTTVGGGAGNIASGNYSSVLGGQTNNTNNKSNAHIIGSNITAPSANYTYVNNISTSGNVASNTAVIASLTSTNVTAASGVITNSQITNLTATNTRVTNLTASNATITAASISGSNLFFSVSSVSINNNTTTSLSADYTQATRWFYTFSGNTASRAVSLTVTGVSYKVGAEIEIYLENTGSFARTFTIFYDSPGGPSALPLAVSPSSVGQAATNTFTLAANGLAVIKAINIGGAFLGGLVYGYAV